MTTPNEHNELFSLPKTLLASLGAIADTVAREREAVAEEILPLLQPFIDWVADRTDDTETRHLASHALLLAVAKFGDGLAAIWGDDVAGNMVLVMMGDWRTARGELAGDEYR